MGVKSKKEERRERHTDRPQKRKMGSLLECGEDDLERELAEMEQREKDTKEQLARLEESAVKT